MDKLFYQIVTTFKQFQWNNESLRLPDLDLIFTGLVSLLARCHSTCQTKSLTLPAVVSVGVGWKVKDNLLSHVNHRMLICPGDKCRVKKSALYICYLPDIFRKIKDSLIICSHAPSASEFEEILKNVMPLKTNTFWRYPLCHHHVMVKKALTYSWMSLRVLPYGRRRPLIRS